MRIGVCIDDRGDRDPAIDRRQDRDLREIRFAAENQGLEIALLCQRKGLRAIGAGLSEERKRCRQIFNRQPRFLSKALRREVIGVAARRRLADLDESLLDAASKVGVDEAKRDAEILGNAALRLGAVIDRIKQIEDDPLVLAAIARHRSVHACPAPWLDRSLRRSYNERQVRRSAHEQYISLILLI